MQEISTTEFYIPELLLRLVYTMKFNQWGVCPSLLIIIPHKLGVYGRLVSHNVESFIKQTGRIIKKLIFKTQISM